MCKVRRDDAQRDDGDDRASNSVHRSSVQQENYHMCSNDHIGWGVGSWRDDAEEVRADIVGIRVSDNLVLYPKAIEMLRAVENLDASDAWV